MDDVLSRLRTELAGRYAVEHELGHGGMAVVYLATDLKHGRKVARCSNGGANNWRAARGSQTAANITCRLLRFHAH